MKHYILTTLIIAFSFATHTYASEPIDAPTTNTDVAINEDNANVSVTVHGTQLTIHAVNCQGQDLKVYDLVGKLKYDSHIDSLDKTIRLQLNKGIYLVNVNKITRRVSVSG